MKTEKEIVEALEKLQDTLDKRAKERFDEFETKWDKNQKAIDDLLVMNKHRRNSSADNQTFQEAFSLKMAEVMNTDASDYNYAVKNKGRCVIELKASTMTTSSSLTGDPVRTYANAQGIKPAQINNLRDFLPTSFSPTGQYVVYRETSNTGSITEQTEGNTKSQMDWGFTQSTVDIPYVAGFTVFSKQYAKNLPWIQNTLPRLLLREYFKKENALFIDDIAAAATCNTTTGETDDVKQLIDVLNARGDDNFRTNYIFCKFSEIANLQKSLYTNGYYAGSGGVLGNSDGSIFISQVPVVGAAWMNAGKVLMIDQDLIERVEAETLKVEFFFEDSTNVRQNLITARVECQTAVNLIRTDGHSYFTI